MRNFQFTDGLVLLFLYFKLSGNTNVPGLTWFAVFSPWLIEIVWNFIGAYLQVNDVTKRLTFWIWKFFMKRRVNRASAQARREVEKQFDEVIKKTSNGKIIKTGKHE
jgi:hypothetical protein